MMSYKERLSMLERILRIDKLLKKYPSLKGRSSSLRNDQGSESSTPSSCSEDVNQSKQCNELAEEVSERCVIAGEGVGGEDVDRVEDGNDRIELDELKRLVFHGLPGDTQYRALVWRLLLNYLPPDRIDCWDEYLAKKRKNYARFIDELLLAEMGCGEDGVKNSDHPLNFEPDSKWQIFFKDNDVLLQIDKDVRRLCPEISFFQNKTLYPNTHVTSGKMDRLHKRVQSCVLESSNVIRKGLGVTKIIGKNSGRHRSSESDGDACQQQQTQQQIRKSSCERVDVVEGEYHWEVVERILFLYAKLNPGQSYVQGMNEIIGPIYYTLANDPNVVWREYAEADTFYLFTNLMGEIRDFFIRSLDNSVSGIKRMMELLMERLRVRDAAVHERLVKLEIHPQYYAFRWITLLMSQEFALPEVLRIWDSLLSDPRRFDFLIDLASAMIIHVRLELLNGDFPSNMKLLQNYPPIDVRDILSLANSFANNS